MVGHCVLIIRTRLYKTVWLNLGTRIVELNFLISSHCFPQGCHLLGNLWNLRAFLPQLWDHVQGHSAGDNGLGRTIWLSGGTANQWLCLKVPLPLVGFHSLWNIRDFRTANMGTLVLRGCQVFIGTESLYYVHEGVIAQVFIIRNSTLIISVPPSIWTWKLEGSEYRSYNEKLKRLLPWFRGPEGK